FAYNIAYLRPAATEAEIWAAAKEAGLHDEIVRAGYQRNFEKPKGDDADEAEHLLDAVKAKLSAAGFSVKPEKSIWDNLARLGKVPFEKIKAEAEAVGIAGDVARVGYLRPVNERGVNMSGGQKQRLSLARVLLSDAEVIILDEPTSALDGLKQQEIQDAL